MAALVLGADVRSLVTVRDGHLVAAGYTPDDFADSDRALLIRRDDRASQACVNWADGDPWWYGQTLIGAAQDACSRGS